MIGRQNAQEIRLRVTNVRDEIEFLAFRSFLVEVQMNAGYIHAVLLMCHVNLQIRIAGFSGRLQ